MQLKRAVELCQAPIDESLSHMVKVDRFALIHVLDDYDKAVKHIAKLEKDNRLLTDQVEQLREEMVAAKAADKEIIDELTMAV